MRHELDLGILILHISCYNEKAPQNLWSDSLKYWSIPLISMFIAFFFSAQLTSLHHAATWTFGTRIQFPSFKLISRWAGLRTRRKSWTCCWSPPNIHGAAVIGLKSSLAVNDRLRAYNIRCINPHWLELGKRSVFSDSDQPDLQLTWNSYWLF